MKKSRFTDSQIVAILKQSEAGTPVPECAVNMASVAPASTNGGLNLVVWTPR